MSTIYTKGEAVGVPPSGKVVLLYDSSGVPYTMDSNGTRTAIASPATGAVSTAMLADGAVTTVKIADANVTLAKLAAMVPTASARGLMPGADPWYMDAVAAAQAVGCTEWSPPGPLVSPTITTAFNDNTIEGGSVSKTNGTSYYPAQSIIQNPKGSTKWLFKIRFKQSIISTAALYSQVGLTDSGGHGFNLTDQNGTFTGNWYVNMFDGTTVNTDTGVAVDTNFHDLEFSHVSTNLIVKLDGVQVASVADTHMTTNPVCGSLTISATMITRWRKCFWGWDGSAI